MQLNALSHYLQNQPLVSSASTEAQQTSGNEQAENPETGAYSPSQRAILISAVAAEFDVQQLSEKDVGRMQLKLQQYGLLQGSDIAGFTILHNNRAQLQPDESLDAVAVLNQAKQRFETDQISYRQRIQVNRMHTLVENLASARQETPRQSA